MKKRFLQTQKVLLVFLFFNFIFFAFQFLNAKPSNAMESSLIQRSVIADERISNTEEELTYPNKIAFVIDQKKNLNSDSTTDVKELYYFYSLRSGLKDIPYHYMIGHDGKIFQTAKNKDITQIKSLGLGDSINIALLTDYSTTFYLINSDNLAVLVNSIMNKYSIPTENISIYEQKRTVNEKGKIETIEIKETSSQYYKEFLQNFKKKLNYKPTPLKFDLKITSLSFPENELEAGSNFEVKLTLKNFGNETVFAREVSSVYLTIQNQERSKFYLAESWSSFNSYKLLNNKEKLNPNEEKEIVLKMYVPLYPPSVSENFVLIDPLRNKIEKSDGEIKIKIKKPELSIIEILSSPIGYVNVRTSPNSGEIIGKVVKGERFLVKDYKDGFYKIDINGKEGWIVKTYVKKI